MGLTWVIGCILSFMGGIGGAFGLQSKRKQELIDITERLYNVQGKEFTAYKIKTDADIARLEGQLQFFQSAFINEFSKAVAESIVNLVNERLPNG